MLHRSWIRLECGTMLTRCLCTAGVALAVIDMSGEKRQPRCLLLQDERLISAAQILDPTRVRRDAHLMFVYSGSCTDWDLYDWREEEAAADSCRQETQRCGIDPGRECLSSAMLTRHSRTAGVALDGISMRSEKRQPRCLLLQIEDQAVWHRS